jgi:hypothetical protein
MKQDIFASIVWGYDSTKEQPWSVDAYKTVNGKVVVDFNGEWKTSKAAKENLQKALKQVEGTNDSKS